ncbi:hypothetical protein ID866_13074 [Astraeus odoratus]|nr:hypothetical protein ID866_13074 [Astraeus odoratus]
MVLSFVVSGVLYGCAVVQTYVYYQFFPRDSWKLKGLVCQSFKVWSRC